MEDAVPTDRRRMGSPPSLEESKDTKDKGVTLEEMTTLLPASSSEAREEEGHSHPSVEEGEDKKGLALAEKAAKVGSSSVEGAREEEPQQGHMKRALKGLTQAMSALAKAKFGFDPASDEDGGDSPTEPPQPTEPPRQEKRDIKKRSSAAVQYKKKVHRRTQLPEEPSVPAPRSPIEPEMLYMRPLLPQDARKKKKAPVAVQPSTLAPAALDASKEEKKTPVVIRTSRTPFAEEALAAFRARRKKEMESEPEESRTDRMAYEARLYRQFWNDMHAGEDACGSYEDITSIPPMVFTNKVSSFAGMQPSLNVFSIKIEEVKGGLSWPLDVYGVVAVRDVVDHNRNILFYRERDNFQTITSQEPYLALTGPSRAVVVTVHPTYFEVDLKVKGDTESEDKDLSMLALCYTSNGPSRSCVLTRAATSRLSTLKFNFGHVVNSVEGTVRVDILGGNWPREYQRGMFSANIASLKGMDLTLLTFRDGTLPVEADGQLKLSRRVITVELVPPEGEKQPKLMLYLKANQMNDKNVKVLHGLSFKPKGKGRSCRIIKVDSCEMKVTVVWSLMATFKCIYEMAM